MDDWDFARRAVDIAKNCAAEDGKSAPPKVAAVVVHEGVVLGEAHRGQAFDGGNPNGDHAEFCALEKVLAGRDLSGATVYTTLEPCTKRGRTRAGVEKVPCALRLIERRVAEVVIGLYDPNPVVYREGWRLLRDAGIRVRDFPADLRSEVRKDNADFLDSFRWAKGEAGSHTFDYSLNGGELLLGPPEASVRTRWSLAGSGAIHALDYDNNVAHARHATEIDDIDDPAALEFSSYATTVMDGQVVVFRNQHGFAVVRVERVVAGERFELKLSYKLRLRGSGPTAT